MEASLVELSRKTRFLSCNELLLCHFEAQGYDESLRRESASFHIVGGAAQERALENSHTRHISRARFV